ncbi:MAG: serine/threonine protein kinase, partial [Planctomycetes bacterium]|nr:serine/threonine protein kinase [Planctomycetota bacterium]
GMGRVYEAFDPELRRRVVVKSLRRELALQEQARERLRREARVLGQLGHGNLTRVIDLVEEDGSTHLVLAFHEGRTLGELLAAARERSEAPSPAAPRWLTIGPASATAGEGLRRLVVFFVTAARALATAHRAGIVHRDLKPQNLMVAPDGAPVVLDFGLALPLDEERLTVAGELLGTPLYMAPEQIEGMKADARTDVYALGVTLYEALTLVHPFAGSGGRAATFHRILRGDPVPPRRHQGLVPRDLEAVVLRAMEREPARRYADMEAVANELQRVLDLEPTEARPVSGFGLVWRRIRRRPWLAAGGAAVLAAVAIAAWNFHRVQDVKELARKLPAVAAGIEGAAKDAPAPAADSLRAAAQGLRILQERIEARSIAQYDEIPNLHAMLPRGKVSDASMLVWVGLPTRGQVGADDEPLRA